MPIHLISARIMELHVAVGVTYGPYSYPCLLPTQGTYKPHSSTFHPINPVTNSVFTSRAAPYQRGPPSKAVPRVSSLRCMWRVYVQMGGKVCTKGVAQTRMCLGFYGIGVRMSMLRTMLTDAYAPSSRFTRHLACLCETNAMPWGIGDKAQWYEERRK